MTTDALSTARELTADAQAIAVGDFVRVEGRTGWWPVWSTLSNEGRVMIEDMPGCAIGPCVVLKVRATPLGGTPAEGQVSR